MPPPPADRQSGAVHVAGYLYLYFPHYDYNLVENYFLCSPAQLILDIFTFIPSNHIVHLFTIPNTEETYRLSVTLRGIVSPLD